MNEKENHFLEHLTAELSLPSREEAIPLVTSVLQALRQTLSRQNAEGLVARMPEFLKSYLRPSDRDEAQVNVQHLDELVTLVMERDTQNVRTLFKSEVQTLAVILFTLKKLFLYVDPISAGIPQPIFREVQEASAELSV